MPLDFMTLLKSAELLLYEVVSWLLFYPLTLWRCIAQPTAMVAYAQQELRKPPDDQFPDALSPPIFLFLSLMIAHLVQTGFFHLQIENGVLADARNLLVFRAVAFSMFPLLLSIQHVRMTHVPLTRQSLRPVFYGQCYITVPFILAFDAGMMLTSLGSAAMNWAGTSVLLVGLAWYVSALMHGFMAYLGVTWHQALRRTLTAVALGTLSFLIAIVIAFLTIPAAKLH